MIKNNLSKILGERCISVAQLARMTGLNAQGLRNLRNKASTQIEFGTIHKSCKALGISVGEVFEYIED